jgi:hypothetical protein
MHLKNFIIKKNFFGDFAPCSVALPGYFCPAPACQKFRLQLGQFLPFNKEKFNDFHGFQQIFMFFKDINDNQKLLKSK